MFFFFLILLIITTLIYLVRTTPWLGTTDRYAIIDYGYMPMLFQ